MASVDARGAAVAPLPAQDRAGAEQSLDLRVAAWLAVLPSAAVVLLAVLLLGGPVGGLLFSGHGSYRFLPDVLRNVRPEPTEHARYLLAVCAPVVLAIAMAVALRRGPATSGPLARFALSLTQVVLAGVLVACFVVQYRLRYGEPYLEPGSTEAFGMRYFTPRTLVAAGLLAGAAIACVRWVPAGRLLALLRDSRARRIACTLVALAATVVWLLSAVHTDASVTSVPWGYRYHLAFTLDETFAVVNGLTPLVDFSAQYASLWPFPFALALGVLGRTVLVYTAVSCLVSGIALLAIFGVLRRVTGSSVAALALYLPFLATSLFFIEGSFTTPANVGNYYAAFPLRYAGPFMLAWLAARHIGRRGGPASAVLVFTVAGLVVLNNVDFGVAAFAATIVALALGSGELRRAPLLRLAARAAAGLAAALALVSLLMLARTGSLPQLWRLTDYAGIYGIGGAANMPIKGVLGLHIAIYLTFVAAIAVATFRLLRGASNRILTGMLAWSGVFGLCSAGYWIGRSHPVALRYLFAAWALALALLTVAVLRDLVANLPRRPALGAVAVLFGFGLCACSLAQLPPPWSQVQRITGSEAAASSTPLEASANASTRAFVTSLADGPARFVAKHGAPVAILLTNGHRVADTYGVRDVSPYTGTESTVTVERVEAVIDALRRAGGNTVILPNQLFASIFRVLERRGFRLVTHAGLRPSNATTLRSAVFMPWSEAEPMPYVPVNVLKWVDARHLHPRALR